MKSILALVLAAVFAVALPLSASGQHQHHDEAAMIEAADTPEEHQALAEHYRAKAAKAREEAKLHQEMGKRYGGPKLGRMKTHCDELVVLKDKIAVEYEQLAEGHEKEAGR